MSADSATLDYTQPFRFVSLVTTEDMVRPVGHMADRVGDATSLPFTELPEFEQGVTIGSYGDVVLHEPYEPYEPYLEHFTKLLSIKNDRTLWPHDAEPPSALAIGLAYKILLALYSERLVPSRVVASAEGGVAACFVDGDKYSDIECLNNGLIMAVTTNRRERPMVWEIASDKAAISRACVRIREFLRT